MDVTLQFDLVKGKRIRWPRYEDAEDIMVAGGGRPLVDAFRIAQVELIEWLVSAVWLEKMEAYQIVSQVGRSNRQRRRSELHRHGEVSRATLLRASGSAEMTDLSGKIGLVVGVAGKLRSHGPSQAAPPPGRGW